MFPSIPQLRDRPSLLPCSTSSPLAFRTRGDAGDVVGHTDSTVRQGQQPLVGEAAEAVRDYLVPRVWWRRGSRSMGADRASRCRQRAAEGLERTVGSKSSLRGSRN
jgi:hypothetical protein